MEPPSEAQEAAWAREFFRLMDAQDFERLAAYIDPDVVLRMANQEPIRGLAAIASAAQQSRMRFESIEHEISGVWSGHSPAGPVISIEAMVTYTLQKGGTVTLPCTSTLRFRGDRVVDYRIFMDPAPAFRD